MIKPRKKDEITFGENGNSGSKDVKGHKLASA